MAIRAQSLLAGPIVHQEWLTARGARGRKRHHLQSSSPPCFLQTRPLKGGLLCPTTGPPRHPYPWHCCYADNGCCGPMISRLVQARSCPMSQRVQGLGPSLGEGFECRVQGRRRPGLGAASTLGCCGARLACVQAARTKGFVCGTGCTGRTGPWTGYPPIPPTRTHAHTQHTITQTSNKQTQPSSNLNEHYRRPLHESKRFRTTTAHLKSLELRGTLLT